MESPAWSDLYRARRAVRETWPDPFRLPVVKSAARAIGAAAPAGGTILDVGAGEGDLREALAHHAPGIRYRSLEPDPGNPADLRDLSEVREPVDAVALLEVIEHLALGEGLDLLRRVAVVLRPGGLLFVSTPNVFVPGRYLRDATHRTPYAYDELGGALTLAGYGVEAIYRTYNAPAVWRALRLWVAAPVHRYLGVDFAPSILAVARRP